MRYIEGQLLIPRPGKGVIQATLVEILVLVLIRRRQETICRRLEPFETKVPKHIVEGTILVHEQNDSLDIF
jgi:hypothetical protein